MTTHAEAINSDLQRGLPEIIEKYKTFAGKSSSYQHVFEVIYGKVRPIKPPKYRLGDRVRSVKKQKTFEKGFTPNWTEKLFTISEVQPAILITHTIKDTKAENIPDILYEPELQQNNKRYIEKVPRSNGVKEVCKVERLQQRLQYVDTAH